MRLLSKTIACLFIVGSILTACTAKDGEDGPVGPVGPEGAIGPAGEGGEDGVANLSVSTLTVPSSAWTGGTIKEFSAPLSDIDQDVMDNGTVQVFQTQTPANPTWDALPYSYLVGINGQPVQVTVQYSYKLDSLKLSVMNSGAFNITSSATYPGDRTFKVVVVPPVDKIDGLDYSDYEAVEMVYGLEN